MSYFDNLSCGSSIPFGNPHAISVHLPTMADVIGYEEQNAVLLDKLESAYPRFRTNRYVADVCSFIRNISGIEKNREIIPVSSARVFDFLETITGKTIERLQYQSMNFVILEKNATESEAVKSFLQHTGMIPSSRQAEDFLLKAGFLTHEFEEKKSPAETAHTIIKETLQKAYGAAESDDVFLMNCGMNAIYSVFESLRKVKNEQNRGLFVQLGWIYLDTMEIIRKYAPQSHRHFDLLNSDSFEAFIKEHSADVAAVFTEIPTNPLIQTVDLPRLSAFLKSQGIPLVVDTSIGTPYTMEILPYADIVIESLTKFAGGNTDEMMGAVILNKHSGHAEAIRSMIGKKAELPYEKDARRLAWEIQGYENRVRKVSENASVIIPYFLHSKKVKRLHWALDGVSGENFRKIMKSEALIPGLVSIIFDQKLQFYYDRLKIAKGPSFGSDFTLGMAYVYLAHFKMLKTEAGRKELSALGIEPEMLRLSIGTESADSIIALFEEL